MPSWELRDDCDHWGNLLDLEVLHKLIGQEYVVAVHLDNSTANGSYYNKIQIPGFSKNLSVRMNLRDLVMASDVITGDYRDTFFEAALLHKPMYSMAYDYKKRIQAWNMRLNAKDFEKLIFCPVIRTAEDLADALSRVKTYDYAGMEQFVSEYMGACDGHSVDRVLRYIMS